MAAVKKYRKENENSYALGITLTFEMLKFKAEYAQRVYIHSQLNQNETYFKLIDLCNEKSVEIVYNDKVFNVLSQKENCYCIGEFKKFYMEPDNDKSHIVLVNPSNAGNIGTIIRSALGFGLNNIAIVRPAVDVFDPKAVRASMGSVFSSNLYYYDTFEEYQSTYSDREFFPFMLQAKKSLKEFSCDGKFSLIFGNEAAGLGDEFLNVGTPLIIRHSDKIDSLNLPIAASIAMYESTKNMI